MGDSLDGEAVRAWVAGFAADFRSASGELDDLDRQSGDGDFGTNLRSAIDRIDADLASAPTSSPAELFRSVSKAFMHAGGTSGPLFGVWFREFARASGELELDREGLARGASAGLQAVLALGQAQPGDKTMVDAMSPVAGVLSTAAAQERDIREDIADAAAAARGGAEATAELVARRGRASYVGELSRGVRDAGAEAVAMFFEAGRSALSANGDHL
ncbi:MAG TPA: dihydroxyacetone kinase subunit DhaL [Solirubrobacteraceae bacterium]|jgi:dihydroxyacetone kinase-like protein